MKARQKRDATLERWWVAYEHPTMGVAHVCFRWRRIARDLYRAEVEAIEFDLFTPHDEQERMIADIRRLKVTTVGDGEKPRP